MKKLTLLPVLFISFVTLGSGQLLCVRCFDQNEAIQQGVVNLISNGGFEQTNCTPGWPFNCWCPNATNYDCDLTDWICTGGDELSYPHVFDTTLSVIPEGNNAAYFGNGNAFTCSTTWGDQSCEVADGCVISGFPTGYPHSNPGWGDATGLSLHQMVSGLSIGQRYVLEFWAGGEPLHELLSEPSIFSVDVGFGKIFLECKSTGETNPIGTRFLVIFDAIATSHQITFTNWGHICDICTELVLDDVRLYTLDQLPMSIGGCITSTEKWNRPEEINIYPNPAREYVTVDHADVNSITLLNIMGQEVWKRKVSGKTVIPLSGNAPGLYILDLLSGTGHVFKSLVIE
jgi:hypothetical protein